MLWVGTRRAIGRGSAGQQDESWQDVSRGEGGGRARCQSRIRSRSCRALCCAASAPPIHHTPPRPTQALLDAALLDDEFLNYRPSATAAAALYAHRLRRGDTPPWPTAAAALTGYADLQHPELAAAVGAVQR